jgi:hypothetical protein
MASEPGAAARGERYALIVASHDYQDPALGELLAPAADADALERVLSDPAIGGFQVTTLLNQPAHLVNEAVEEFLADRSPDDLLLLHFSGHGIKDQGGELYFAMANTRLRLLAATAVAANFVNRLMTQSRSRRIVLFLDCCYAGAFERGMTSRAGQAIDLEGRFEGRGRAVITASGAVEYAFEAGELTESGDPAPSVFTTAMVRGLSTGEADRDQDGYVDLDELYDYVFDAVREVTPHQTPGKWTYGVQGDLVIARRVGPVTAPAPLPAELQLSVESPLAGVRAGAVAELAKLLGGRHEGRSVAARQALEQLAVDDSRTVSAAASAALAAGPPWQAPAPDVAGAQRSDPSTAPVSRPDEGRPVDGQRNRGWARRRPSRRLLVAVGAAVLLVGAVVAWLLGRGSPANDDEAQVPAAFDGQWAGSGTIPAEGVDSDWTLELTTGFTTAQLVGTATACASGELDVTETDGDLMTMRFYPPGDCTPATVTMEKNGADTIIMKIQPDETARHEQRFEVALERS